MRAAEVVLLAYEPSVPHDVELVAGEQLLAADEADEAVEVEDAVAGLPDHVLRVDRLAAAAAPGAVSAAEKQN